MSATIINNEERKRKGLPEVKVSRSGKIYTSPSDIINSEQGKNLIYKLSKIDIPIKPPEKRGSKTG